jgi:hypothetical protein
MFIWTVLVMKISPFKDKKRNKFTDSPEYLQCDVAAEEDSLGFKLYVESIADFLTSEKTVPPLTLSIEGQWGCGKSSFMKQLIVHQ